MSAPVARRLFIGPLLSDEPRRRVTTREERPHEEQAAGEEPGPELDARVLDAARQAAAETPKRSGGLGKRRVPMSVAATILVAVGLVPVLRAGLGMVEGIWEMMPGAEVWHIGLYRDERTLRPVSYYNKLPVDPTVQVCLVLDPMLATGGTAVETVDILKRSITGLTGAQAARTSGRFASTSAGMPWPVSEIVTFTPPPPARGDSALDSNWNEVFGNFELSPLEGGLRGVTSTLMAPPSPVNLNAFDSKLNRIFSSFS